MTVPYDGDLSSLHGHGPTGGWFRVVLESLLKIRPWVQMHSYAAAVWLTECLCRKYERTFCAVYLTA